MKDGHTYLQTKNFYSRFLQGIQVKVDQPCKHGKQCDKAGKELHMAKRGSP